MDTKSPKRKGRIKVIVLRIIAILFIIFQILGYIGAMAGDREIPTDSAERIGFYIGFNFFLYISIIFFVWAARVKKKMKLQKEIEIIETIGKAE